MSGGSYSYLCYKDSIEILNRITTLKRMYSRLLELGQEEAANETLSIIQTAVYYINNMELKLDKISPVWKSVEWMDSLDGDYVDVELAIDKFKLR